jgi:hypothetical protein
MTERVFGWWLTASFGLHAAGMLAVSLAHTSIDLSPHAAVAIEVVRMPAPEPPPPPPPPPRVKAVGAPGRGAGAPPRRASTIDDAEPARFAGAAAAHTAARGQHARALGHALGVGSRDGRAGWSRPALRRG